MAEYNDEDCVFDAARLRVQLDKLVFARDEIIAFEIWRRKRGRMIMDEIGQWPSVVETPEQMYESYLQSKTINELNKDK